MIVMEMSITCDFFVIEMTYFKKKKILPVKVSGNHFPKLEPLI